MCCFGTAAPSNNSLSDEIVGYFAPTREIWSFTRGPGSGPSGRKRVPAGASRPARGWNIFTLQFKLDQQHPLLSEISSPSCIYSSHESQLSLFFLWRTSLEGNPAHRLRHSSSSGKSISWYKIEEPYSRTPRSIIRTKIAASLLAARRRQALRPFHSDMQPGGRACKQYCLSGGLQALFVSFEQKLASCSNRKL